MSNKTKHIIGILAEIEDPNTGVPAQFHVVSDYHVSEKYATATATLESYFSKKHHDNGKQALGSQSMTLYGKPERGQDTLDWVYRSIVAAIPDGATDVYGNPITAHAFTGAELVA